MPATGWTTSSSRSSVSLPPPPPSPRALAAAPAVAEPAAAPALTAARRRRRRRSLLALLFRAAAGRPARSLFRSSAVRWLRSRRCVVGCRRVLGCRRSSLRSCAAVGCSGCWSALSAAPSRRPGRRRSVQACRVGARALRCGRSRLGSLLGAAGRRAGVAAAGPVGGRGVAGGLPSAGRLPARVGARGVGGRWPVAAAFPDRGDQFALTHTGGALDADLIGQRAQFGQHHGRQRAVEATRSTRARSSADVWQVSVVTGSSDHGSAARSRCCRQP